ncbi:hypothetical protein [Chitinophaga sp. LS1]|uniref:hypothetical protein n=1 Tax=Chitinophaga sp. LS1 TaxID=3051176 RepID=UPI002AAC0A93|nr:hypothetical protein [Chitinophaga sp. LS1]WPV65955.1 hypothetical protein QQL36_29580 [Chitinophaga sp. LS1]
MEKYLSFRNLHERTETYIELLKRINVIVQPFYTGTLSVDEIVAAVDVLKRRVEPDFKKYLSSLISDGIISKNGDDDLVKRSEEFLNTNYDYFKDKAFLDDELNAFAALRLSVLEQLQEMRFKSYKSMLVEQLSQNAQQEVV